MFVSCFGESGHCEGLFFMLGAAFNTMCSGCNPAWDIKFLDSRACTLCISVDPTVPSTGLGKWQVLNLYSNEFSQICKNPVFIQSPSPLIQLILQTCKKKFLKFCFTRQNTLVAFRFPVIVTLGQIPCPFKNFSSYYYTDCKKKRKQKAKKKKKKRSSNILKKKNSGI